MTQENLRLTIQLHSCRRGRPHSCRIEWRAGSTYTPAMNAWLRLALQPSVVKRALKYAVVVGLILIGINHLDNILRGDITRGRLFKMALTFVVPYVVSTMSSVGALRQRDKG